MAKQPHRADDKRRGGYSDNSFSTVHASYGNSDPLFNFHDRRGRNGTGKRAF